jgi:hypothetical protein
MSKEKFVAIKEGKRYIGYCPLNRECVPFAVTKEDAVVCFVGGIGNTCEHLIITLEQDLEVLEKMEDSELVKYYSQVFYDGIKG